MAELKQLTRLTKREREALITVATGMTAAQAGLHLGVKTRSVRKYRSAAYKKLEAKNAAHAVYLLMKDSVSRIWVNGGMRVLGLMEETE